MHEILEKPRFHCRSRHKREGGSSSSGRNRARISLSLRIGAHRVAAEKRHIPGGVHTMKHDVETCVRFASLHSLSHLCACFSFSVARSRREIRVLAKRKKAYRNKTSARSYISPLSQFHLVLCHSISIYFVMRLGAWLSRAHRIRSQ